MYTRLTVVGSYLVLAYLLVFPSDGLGIAPAGPMTKVTVKGARVNLRAKPSKQSEVVAQVTDGNELKVKSMQRDWVEIEPPRSVFFWVHKEFVKEGLVTASKLHVRAGAGINYSVVGNLIKGESVFPQGEFGDWMKIVAPYSSSLWISRDLVERVGNQPGSETAQAGSPGDPYQPGIFSPLSRPRPKSPSPVAKVVNEKPKHKFPPPEDLQLIPLQDQGKNVQREGVLKRTGFVIGRPSSFRLVSTDMHKRDTICYIRGNNRQLTSFLGRRMLIRGRQYWVQGVRHPVVIPEQIVPRVNP